MTNPADQPGLPEVPDHVPPTAPHPMPEEAPGHDAPVPVYDPPANPDTPGLPGETPTPNPDTPGIGTPEPMSI